jgi:predicted nucleic acid-binding protein
VKLLDTMLIVYARTPSSRFHKWAVEEIAKAVSTEGAALNPVSLAELCGEDGVDETAVAAAVQQFGVELVNLPVAAAEKCGAAYRVYRHKRKSESGKESPRVPLPDFFIGAHAEAMGWNVITNDPQRFRIYFPKVKLIVPP